MINILIAEASPLFLLALKKAIEDQPDMILCGICSDKNQIFIAIEKSTPDIVVVDENIWSPDFQKEFKSYTNERGNVKWLLLCDSIQPVGMRKIFSRGLDGVLLKMSTPEQLIDAIHTLAVGENYIQPEIQKSLAESWLFPRPCPVYMSKLTKREKEVLQLIVDEMTTKEISQILFISEATVETHRWNLINKLGVKNIAGLVKVALFRKLCTVLPS